MLLPHLQDNSGSSSCRWPRRSRCPGSTRSASSASRPSRPSVESVLDDDTLDAVFIVTRHHSHADLVCQALERGQAVFVEKPLALTDEQLAAVLDTVEGTGNDRLMVGFNRRFAPLFADLQERFGAVPRPGVGPLPGQRRAAGAEQLVPQRGARGVAVRRRGRPLHRHPERPGRARPGRGVRHGRRGPDVHTTPALRRRVGGDDLLRDRGQLAFPEGDPRRRRRRPQRTAGQLPAGHRVVGQGQERPPRRSPGRTRASGTDSSASSMPSERAPRCRSRWSPWSRRRARRSPSGPACRQEGRWPGESSHSRLVHPTTARDVADRGGLPHPGCRAPADLGAAPGPAR